MSGHKAIGNWASLVLFPTEFPDDLWLSMLSSRVRSVLHCLPQLGADCSVTHDQHGSTKDRVRVQLLITSVVLIWWWLAFWVTAIELICMEVIEKLFLICILSCSLFTPSVLPHLPCPLCLPSALVDQECQNLDFPEKNQWQWHSVNPLPVSPSSSLYSYHILLPSRTHCLPPLGDAIVERQLSLKHGLGNPVSQFPHLKFAHLGYYSSIAFH